MFTVYLVVTVLTVAANLYGFVADVTKPQWLLTNMTELSVPEDWLFPLGAAKALGAIGLLVGFGVPAIGVAAAVGLMLFFVGAMTTVLRARAYGQFVYPATYFTLAVGALVTLLAQ